LDLSSAFLVFARWNLLIFLRLSYRLFTWSWVSLSHVWIAKLSMHRWKLQFFLKLRLWTWNEHWAHVKQKIPWHPTDNSIIIPTDRQRLEYQQDKWRHSPQTSDFYFVNVNDLEMNLCRLRWKVKWSMCMKSFSCMQYYEPDVL
jgi:hypothetical protein